uniref:Uncharacterized protein n=1 Tax=Arundo donax TaxID=35708 RepID=A0A0A9DZK7_ARUDO
MHDVLTRCPLCGCFSELRFVPFLLPGFSPYYSSAAVDPIIVWPSNFPYGYSYLPTKGTSDLSHNPLYCNVK